MNTRVLGARLEGCNPWLVSLGLMLGAAMVLTVPGEPADQGFNSASRIGFALGVPYIQVRDDIVGPLRWDGPGGAIEIFYDHVGGATRHQLDLTLPLGLLTNRYGHRAAALGFKLGYTYFRPVMSSAEYGTAFAGGLLRWDEDLQFYADWDDEHLYWITACDLAPAVLHELRLGRRHRFDLGLDFAVLSLVSRPPSHRYYKIDDLTRLGFWFRKPHQGIRLTSVGRHLAVDASLDYALAISRSWLVGVAYELAYRRYTEPETIQSLSNTILIRATYEF